MTTTTWRDDPVTCARRTQAAMAWEALTEARAALAADPTSRVAATRSRRAERAWDEAVLIWAQAVGRAGGHLLATLTGGALDSADLTTETAKALRRRFEARPPEDAAKASARMLSLARSAVRDMAKAEVNRQARQAVADRRRVAARRGWLGTTPVSMLADDWEPAWPEVVAEARILRLARCPEARWAKLTEHWRRPPTEAEMAAARKLRQAVAAPVATDPTLPSPLTAEPEAVEDTSISPELHAQTQALDALAARHGLDPAWLAGEAQALAADLGRPLTHDDLPTLHARAEAAAPAAAAQRRAEMAAQRARMRQVTLWGEEEPLTAPTPKPATPRPSPRRQAEAPMPTLWDQDGGGLTLGLTG